MNNDVYLPQPIGTNVVGLATKATAILTDAKTLRCTPEILTETRESTMQLKTAHELPHRGMDK